MFAYFEKAQNDLLNIYPKVQTTSDYGHDSYEFAKDKPLKLLNSGHLLSLLHKHGRSAHINIEDAREQFKNAKN